MIHSNLQIVIDESGDSVLDTIDRYDAEAELLSDFVDVLQAMHVGGHISFCIFDPCSALALSEHLKNVFHHALGWIAFYCSLVASL